MDTHISMSYPLIQSRSHLVENLKFNYGLIIATEDLLRFAASISHREYFMGKLKEETGHAEWLLNDLKGMGEIPKVDHDAACIVGAQFYYIRYISPLMLLGYMSALESNPMSLSDIDVLEKTYGKLPTLRYHAEHDIKHGREVREEIEKIDDDSLKGKILYNEQCTRTHIAKILQSRFEGCGNA